MIEHSTGWTPRRIDVPSVPNLREVGGAPAEQGSVVRSNVLFRSTQLASLDDDDLPVLEALNLAMVVDLRTAGEVQRAPDVRVTDTYVWLDVLRDFAMASAVGVEDVFADPRAFEAILRDGTAAALMHEAYLAMVDLPSARESYGRWLADLASGKGPVLVHCTNGKDRTGWAVALVLLAVGVDVDDVMTDYLTTNEQLLPVLEELFASVSEQGIDPALLLPVMGVHEDYLATALERVERLGGLDAYLELLGIGDTQRSQLVRRLTEPAAG
ncbi:MAG: tyrosine-protein phosphatase [Candidatus Nanopelagicales bacterium]